MHCLRVKHYAHGANIMLQCQAYDTIGPGHVPYMAPYSLYLPYMVLCIIPTTLIVCVVAIYGAIYCMVPYIVCCHIWHGGYLMTHPRELAICRFDIVALLSHFDCRAVPWFAGCRTLGATLLCVCAYVCIPTYTREGCGRVRMLISVLVSGCEFLRQGCDRVRPCFLSDLR